MLKFIPTITIGGLIALSLVACSSPGASDCVPTPAGSHSSAITVTGAANTEPKVKIPIPLDTKVTERSVVTEGKGEVVKVGMQATIDYVVYNASTGDKLGGSEFSSKGAISWVIDEKHLLKGMVKTIQCSTVGSRIVSIVPPADAFGADGPNVGVGVTDSLVFVFDIKKVEPAPTESPSATPSPTPIPHLDRADGKSQPPQKGFPKVVLANDGTPTVTIPDADPPSKLKLEVLKKGSGAVVPKGATVVVHYVGLIWATNGIFDSSWNRGEPATFSTARVIAGFSAAIVGQTIGSQVVVIIPPSEGYGPDGNPGAKISGTDTLVFVVDILGAA